MEELKHEVSYNHMDSTTSPPGGPGIMLLTNSMQLLYSDQRAWELCRQIIRCQDGKTAHGVLPPAIATLVDQVRNLLQTQTDPKDWDQLQLRHVVHTSHISISLCGTALVGDTDAGNRILIVINEVGIGAWQDYVIVQAKEKFNLTARETTVVHLLLKGWTNKEIANEMKVAEATIKQHVKHISEKTSATTRIGIAMTVIRSGLGQAGTVPSRDVLEPPMRKRPIGLVGAA